MHKVQNKKGIFSQSFWLREEVGKKLLAVTARNLRGLLHFITSGCQIGWFYLAMSCVVFAWGR